ncbi:MAG: tetratricopeptide repeat protein [Leptospiraceae bacterium]|nr:tetratricopeptide repeat protein [Leptospiraceae bacterium]MCP5513068.1 tetratricopeptide repeat protein [Leptospiraceae bacterium]
MSKKKNYIREINKNNFALALTMIDNELTKDPENPELLYNLAICCSRTGNHKKCISVLEKLLKFSFKFVEIDNVYRLIIYSHIRLKNYSSALDITDERLKINVGDLPLLSFRAHIMEKQNKLEDAITIHRNILKIKPDYKNSLNSLAYLLAIQTKPSKEDIAEANEYIKKALSSDPGNAAYLDTFGVVLKLNGNKDQALRAFNKALAKAPEATSEILDHLQDLL